MTEQTYRPPNFAIFSPDTGRPQTGPPKMWTADELAAHPEAVPLPQHPHHFGPMTKGAPTSITRHGLTGWGEFGHMSARTRCGATKMIQNRRRDGDTEWAVVVTNRDGDITTRSFHRDLPSADRAQMAARCGCVR